MELNLRWQDWVGIVCVALICALIYLGWPQWDLSSPSSQAMAFWVQAFGSILALGVAIYLSQDERRQNREERQQEKADRHGGAAYDLAAIAVEIHMRIVELMSVSLEGRNKEYYLGEVLFFKDVQRRMIACTSGDVPMSLKNLGLEIRRSISLPIEYVIARSFDKNPPEPDWRTLAERADRLFGQAQMFVPKQA